MGGHSAGKEGKLVSEVAEDKANSVLKYYPTVTESKTQIQKAFEDRINQLAFGQNSAVTDKAVVSATVAFVALAVSGAVLL